MKKIFLFFLFILPCSVAFSQSWSAMDGGITGGGLTASIFGGQLYVGGSFIVAGSNGDTVNRIARWNGASWTDVNGGANNTVYALQEVNGDLYAGGRFNSIGGINGTNCIAKWNGTSWDSVGHGLLSSGTAYVRAITSYNGNLVVAGSFTSAGSVAANNIAMWNGTGWMNLGAGVSGGIIYALEVYNGQLYAGGSFITAGTDTCYGLAKWDGTNWSACGPGFIGNVLALKSFNGQLMIGGTFFYDGLFNEYDCLAMWDGTNLNHVGSGASDHVYSFCKYGSKLYIGGRFHNVDGHFASGITSWDGTTYDQLGGGVTFTQFGVEAMAADDGYLFATGTFTLAGGNPAVGVAQWNVLLSENDLANRSGISIYPNPSNGIFNFHSENIPDNETIEIYNSLGEKINSFAVKNEDEPIDLSNEAKGIYFCRVISGNKTVSEFKVVVE